MGNSGKHIELSVVQRIGLAMLWGFSCVVSYSPRWVRYGLVQPFVKLLLHLIGYRRKMVMSNLASAFPEKSKSEIRKIGNRFYTTLSEVIVDTISLAKVSPEQRGRNITWENGEEHRKSVAGRDWVALAAHFGCWEYFPMWAWELPDDKFMSVYHPLRSKVFEAYYRRIRNYSPNISQVAMKESVRHYISHRSKDYGICLGLISDQSPRMTVDTEWFEFFGRKTAFVDGGERLAIKFGLPAYFCYTRRVRSGEYAVRFVQIYDGVERVEHHEIMRRYARLLEQMIRECPELWMWSHNRWRHTPETQRKKYGRSTLDE